LSPPSYLFSCSVSYEVLVSLIDGTTARSVGTLPRPDATNPSIGVQKLDFGGAHQYGWSMGATGAPTCGDIIQVDTQSDLACGAPGADATSITNLSYDLDPSQISSLVVGEAPGSPYHSFDVLIGCWNLSNGSPPAPLWTYRLGSTSTSPWLSTSQLKNAFTNPYVVQSVTRRFQNLVWQSSDPFSSLPAPNPLGARNPYFWSRLQADGRTLWNFYYATNLEYVALFIFFRSSSVFIVHRDLFLRV